MAGFEMPSFIFGPGEKSTTPEEAKRKRAIAAALASEQKAPANLGEGFTRISEALLHNKYMGDATKAESEGSASAKAIIDALIAKGDTAGLQDYMGALSDPWVQANPGMSAIAQAGFGQEMQQSDPAYQLGLEKTQLEMDALRNPQPDYPTSYDEFLLGQQNPDYAAQLAAGDQPMVTVNTGDVDPGGGKDFYKGLDEQQGKMFSTLIDNGMQAQVAEAKIGQLGELLKVAPQGMSGAFTQALGQFGIDGTGLDEVQAAQAIINQLVPQQRPAGSGTMSDADLALFKASLPAIMNQPGGNQLIVQTMQAINAYTRQQADIAAQVANREIAPTQGREALLALPNPLANFKGSGQDQIVNAEDLDWGQ